MRCPVMVVPVALILLAASGCGGKAMIRSPRIAVTVATVTQRDLPFALVATGTVEPLNTAAVGSQVGGTVQRVTFREGDAVREGQVLFELDPRPFRTALEQAIGALTRDRAQAENARLDADRSKRLFEQNMVAQADWDQKRAAYDGWIGTVRADSAAVAGARLNLQYASIRAPISGRTGQLMVHEGDLIKAATSEPLVTINQVQPVRVRFTVPQDQVGMVQRHRAGGPKVIVRPASGDSSAIEGRLVFIDNAVDPASGTLLLKGEFGNRDGRLWPGEFVNVRLVLFVQPKVTVVPAPAVTLSQQGQYVYVMNTRDSTVASRPVVVERTEDEVAVVSKGLTPGEVVVTDGQLRLSPGARVVVRREPTAAPQD